jgi:membrane protease YdiL (CAAX protease family)
MRFIVNIFANSEGRMRSGWRVTLQFLGFFILLILVQIIQQIGTRSGLLVLFFIADLVYIGGILLMLFVLGRWIDKRPFLSYGFHLNSKWWQDFAFGMVLGAVSLTTVFFIEKSAGWLTIGSMFHSSFNVPFIITACAILLFLIAVGLGEEITFRGYMLRNLAEGFGKGKNSISAVAAAFIVSSVIFALAHGANPNASLMSTVNIALAGLVIGLGYVLTGELAIPIGMHIAWNFFEEFVYGFPNSGQVPANWLIGSVVNGPALWTGGAFGPEAGLIVTLLLIVDAALIAVWVWWRRRKTGLCAELSEYRRQPVDKV